MALAVLPDVGGRGGERRRKAEAGIRPARHHRQGSGHLPAGGGDGFHPQGVGGRQARGGQENQMDSQNNISTNNQKNEDEDNEDLESSSSKF